MRRATIYWHDYETSGSNPSLDRPWQFAGVRTSPELELIGDGLTLYSKPTPDRLPHPTAVRITGISPMTAEREGLSEQAFIERIHQELAQPGTCGAGYNSLRFDDEVTRFTLWRNFYDPYVREYSHGNSRWDLIDVVRAFYALRPEALNWPYHDDGKPSFKLEHLTAANGIEHGAAHDAMSDVLATIEVARKLRQADAVLFDELFARRFKPAVEALIDSQAIKPFVYVSGTLGTERHCLTAVAPLAPHPTVNSEVICADLRRAPDFLDESPAELARRLFAKKDDLLDSEARPPLMTIRVNRAPLVLPMAALTPDDAKRLQLDGDQLRAHLTALREARSAMGEQFGTHIKEIYGGREREPILDPDASLYSGDFLSRADKAMANEVRQSTPAELRDRQWVFADVRLPDLLFRYRARNWPQHLSDDETVQWREHCLTQWQSGFSKDDFDQALGKEREQDDLSDRQRQALDELEQWVTQLSQSLAQAIE